MTNAARLVIDTNILVAAVRNSSGPSFALMQLVQRQAYWSRTWTPY